MARGAWCITVGEVVQIEALGLGKSKSFSAPKWIRCPRCNRRLRPRVQDCEAPFETGLLDTGQLPHWTETRICAHVLVPPHKRRHK